MTQYEQFIAMLKSAGVKFEEIDWLDKDNHDIDVTIRGGDTEETWFTFNRNTGELIEVCPMSSHYSE